MSFYYIMITIILFLHGYENSPYCLRLGRVQKREQIIIIVGIVLLFTTVFRGLSVGGDLINYLDHFNAYQGIRLNEFLKMCNHDWAFYLFFWIVGQFTDNFSVAIGLIGSLSICFLLMAVYKNSANITLSVFICVWDIIHIYLVGLDKVWPYLFFFGDSIF